jgi:AcrR family transcriptional regulator
VRYDPVVTGLRARKRANTSQAIVDATMTLVRDRALSDVSVEEISEAAGVARRTFFRYFPTKEDVILDPRRVDRAYAIDALTVPRPEVDDIDRVMGVLAELQRRAFAVFRPEHQLDVHRLTHREPALAARSWLLMEEMRDVIVDGLVRDRTDRGANLRARLLASACIMVVDTSVTAWIEGGMTDDLDRILAEGTDHLRRGFAPLPRQDPAGTAA